MAEFDERYPEDVHPVANSIGSYIAMILSRIFAFFRR